MIPAGWFKALAPTGTRLSVSGVCKAFGGVPVLYPVDFDLDAGSCLAVLGPNGSGKTTLLRLIAGLERASAGEVVTATRPAGIGFVGHDSYLYEDLTGLENLRFWLKMSDARRNDVEIGAALEIVSLQGPARERVRGYSAGMKRRLGLARLLLVEPDVILLDEPHASLDADGQSLVDSIVSAARDSGRHVIISSHDHDRAVQLAGKVLCLDSGRVSFYGDASEWKRRSPLFLLPAESS